MTDNWKKDIIEKRLGGKTDWTDKERTELCQQLDEEIENQLDNCCAKGKRLEDGWTEENWKEKMAEHPMFSPYLQEPGETDAEASVNPLSEGLAQLKYSPDHNSPLEIAKNYKEDGIIHFKYKKYRKAIASFTEGLKQNSQDPELNAQLNNNRAAAHLHIKNYRSAIKDCERAVDLLPTYRKAILRAVECATKIPVWDEVIQWCDRGLRNDPTDADLLASRRNANQEKKKTARDERKKEQTIKKQECVEMKLLSLIKKRGITLGIDQLEHSSSITLADLECHHPNAQGSRVYLDDNECLIWPVMFVYPEYKETDFIQQFNEHQCFSDHLQMMFGQDNSPPWDEENKYISSQLRLFYEDSNEKLIEINHSDTLLQIISDQRYRVVGGTPNFIILVNGSKFMDVFTSKYNK